MTESQTTREEKLETTEPVREPCKKCTLPELCNEGRSCIAESVREARARENMYREAGYP